MKTKLESCGTTVAFIDGEIMPPIAPAGSLLTLCAWCDPKHILWAQIIAAGFKVSHGICARHLMEQQKLL